MAIALSDIKASLKDGLLSFPITDMGQDGGLQLDSVFSRTTQNKWN